MEMAPKQCKMKHVIWVLLIALSLSVSISKVAFATSSYVLPYPGAMPGNVLHKLHTLQEKISPFWYFGSFSKFSYNLKESDHYLVEAKTLFEYNQYLLAVNALDKSNLYFEKAIISLQDAKQEGKNISEKSLVLKNASEKHQEILTSLFETLPKVVEWRPEKEEPTPLPLHQKIKEAIKEREIVQ